MSMISEQIKEIKACAYAHDASGDAIYGTVGILYQAADTIEALYAKLTEYIKIGTVEECQGARERQIPRKPNKRQVGTNILMSKIYYCPTCNKKLYDCAIKNGKLDYVSPGSRKSKFCGDCGQALDWSDTP